MGEVRSFPGAARVCAQDEAPDAQLVEFLQDLLERASAGRLRAIAVVTVVDSEHTQTAWAPAGSPFSHLIMAGIADLQYRYASFRFGDDD